MEELVTSPRTRDKPRVSFGSELDECSPAGPDFLEMSPGRFASFGDGPGWRRGSGGSGPSSPLEGRRGPLTILHSRYMMQVKGKEGRARRVRSEVRGFLVGCLRGPRSPCRRRLGGIYLPLSTLPGSIREGETSPLPPAASARVLWSRLPLVDLRLDGVKGGIHGLVPPNRVPLPSSNTFPPPLEWVFSVSSRPQRMFSCIAFVCGALRRVHCKSFAFPLRGLH